MAASDYWLCDVCEAKTFYDANLDYGDREYLRRGDSRMLPVGAGDMACICRKCAEKHEVSWRPIARVGYHKDDPVPDPLRGGEIT